MITKIKYASGVRSDREEEISTLAQLLELQKKEGDDLIIRESKNENEFNVLVYDDYLE